MTPATALPQTLVVCLCAQWCGTCRDYASRFEQAGQGFPSVRFLWIDIEDEADLVDPVEVDDFPTLLIVRDGQPVFFGPLLPHLETLERLVSSSLQDPAPRPLTDVPTRDLVRRVLTSDHLTG